MIPRLKEIFEEIKNDDKNINLLDINEQLDIQTYYYLVEVMDLKNIYSYEATDKFSAFFIDKNNIKHFIRIAFQPLTTKSQRYDLKFGFFDENGKACFARPNIHYNLEPDEKIFNTHIYILLKKFIEEDDFFEKIKNNDDKLYLPAIDYSRYRLFKMSLNKFLDKTKYELLTDDQIKNCLIIKQKNNEKRNNK